MKSHFKSLLVLFTAFTPTFLVAQNLAQLELTADDPVEFSQEDKFPTVCNKTEFLCRYATIKADEISFKTEESLINTSGNVRFSNKATQAVSDEVSCQFNQKFLTFCSHSTTYLSENDPFSLDVKTQQLLLRSEDNSPPPDRITAKNAVFRTVKTPFFFFPSYSHSLKKYPVSISSDISFRDDLGLFLRNDILFTSHRNFEWGRLLDYYTKRGFLVGPQVNYDLPLANECSYLEGNLKAGYINDTGSRGIDAIDKTFPQNRYFVNNQQRLQLGERFSIINQLRWWSDSEVVRDFRPRLFNNNQEPDNFSEAVYSCDNYYISIFARFRPNDYQRVQERLPEINFDLINSPVFGTGLYYRGNVNYVYLREKDPINGTPDLFSNRLDGYYGLHYPINMTRALTVTPVLGGRITHYLSTSLADNFTRLRGQIGLDVDVRAFGQWDYCNENWSINGLQHIFRPVMRYRYIPQAHSGSGVIPRIERDLFTTNLDPIDLGNFRNRDDAREVHTLRFGVENLIQTRDFCYGSRELAYFNFYQDVRFSPQFDENTYSDLYAELGLTPAKWLNFSLFSEFNPEHLILREFRTRLNIIDGCLWSLDFTTDNLIHATDQYFLGLQWHPTSRASLYGKWRFDVRLKELSEQVYGLRTRIGNTWMVNYRVIYRQGTQREDDIGFSIDIGLMRSIV